MEQFLIHFQELFDEKPSVELNEDTFFKDISEWDSLFSLSLIVMVSNNYNKSIDGEIIRSCEKIRDLFKVINA